MQERTEGFEVFVAIVEAGSISAAARALDEPRETLSRRLARLEQRLGVRLIHRGPRTLKLTQAGQTLYERAGHIVQAAAEVQAAVQRLDDVPRGLLRVTVPPGAERVFTRMTLAFMDRYPEVSVQVLSTSRYVELVAEGIDVAIRAGVVHDRNLIARVLWRSEAVVAGAPDYLERRGRPLTPVDLADHECLLGTAGGARTERVWPLRDGGTVAVQGRLACNDLAARYEAVLMGYGLALIPLPFARAAMEAGELEIVLRGQVGTDVSLSLVYVEREFLPAKVRAYVDHAVAWIREHGVVEGLLASELIGRFGN